MKKFIVFGGDGFLGFEITCQLLDAGYEVVHYDIFEKSFTEEKLLFIGRNSNFQVNNEIETVLTSESYGLIFPMYDWILLRKEQQETLFEKIGIVLESVQSKKISLQNCCLLPVANNNKHWLKQLNLTEGKMHNTVTFYLPILYGDTMPEEALFYHSMKSETISRNADILYLTDAVESIIPYITSSEKGNFLLKNKNKNRWNEIYQYVSGIKTQIYGLKEADESIHDQIIEVEEKTVDQSTILKDIKKKFGEFTL